MRQLPVIRTRCRFLKRRRAVVRVAAGLALCAPLGLLAGQSPARAALSSFTVVAGADGVRDQVTVPDAPLSSTVVDAGAPTAQATVDALGTSSGFAANPYPGATVLSGPGLLAAETGVSPPGYPFIASTSYPTTQSASAENGELTANSAASSSTAKAGISASPQINGAGLLSASAVAQVEPDGGVTGQAVEDAADLDFGGVLHIGSVHSQASLEVASDGTEKPSSTTTISDATVAGVAVSISDQGITVSGQKAGLPDTSAVSAPLASAGISVQVLKPVISQGSVLSGALVVSVSQQGDTHVFTFGRANASVQDSTGPSSLSGPELTGGVLPSGTGGDVSGGSVSTTGASIGAGSPTGGAAAAVASPELAPGGSGLSPAGGAPAASGRQGAGLGSGSLVAFSRLDNVGLFVIVILAALVILGGSLLVRIHAVRRPWTS